MVSLPKYGPFIKTIRILVFYFKKIYVGDVKFNQRISVYSVIFCPYRFNSRIYNRIQFILTIPYNICKSCRVQIFIYVSIIIGEYFCDKTINQENTGFCSSVNGSSVFWTRVKSSLFHLCALTMSPTKPQCNFCSGFRSNADT